MQVQVIDDCDEVISSDDFIIIFNGNFFDFDIDFLEQGNFVYLILLMLDLDSVELLVIYNDGVGNIIEVFIWFNVINKLDMIVFIVIYFN